MRWKEGLNWFFKAGRKHCGTSHPERGANLPALGQADTGAAAWEPLATIFAIMQLTDEKKIHGSLGSGPFEDFLGKHGEVYLDVIHSLALEHRRLREVLDNVWQGGMPKGVWHKIEMLKQRAF